MVLPYKLNLVTIKIKQAPINSGIVDPDYGEPAAPYDFSTVSEITLEGQVNMMGRQFESMFQALTGDKNFSTGHLVFRNPITDTSGNLVTLQKGDKITNIAGVDTDLFITESRPESPLDGSYLLWYVRFTNNIETRESR